jgi:hypothetical protein
VAYAKQLHAAVIRTMNLSGLFQYMACLLIYVT